MIQVSVESGKPIAHQKYGRVESESTQSPLSFTLGLPCGLAKLQKVVFRATPDLSRIQYTSCRTRGAESGLSDAKPGLSADR